VGIALGGMALLYVASRVSIDGRTRVPTD
jgi:hypothetical protein